jgi:hypothetical protein
MATYYVDLNASSNGTGTESSPYFSFAPFVSSIAVGDRIRVKRGSTKVLTSGTRLNVTVSGAGSVLIDAYGDGAPPVLDAGGNFNPIYIKRVDGGARLTVRDLDVTRGAHHGCAIESQSGVTISNVLLERIRAYGNNTLLGLGKDGISVDCAVDGGLISNVRIVNCDAYDNNGHGIKVRNNTRNVWVVSSRAWNNGILTPSHGMGTAHARALVASAGAWTATSGGAYQATISTASLLKTTVTAWSAVYCSNQNGHFWLAPSLSSPPAAGQFYVGGSNTLEINVGAAPTAANVYAAYLPVNAFFIGNEVYDTIDFDGVEGHGFGTDDMTESAVYIGNVSRDNEGCGWTANVSQGAKWAGNLILRNEKQGVLCSAGKNCKAYGNTILSNGQQGWRAVSGATGGYLRNNVIALNAGYGISSSSPSYTIDEDYNCVYGNVAGAKENVSTSGPNGLSLDPQLDVSYRLSEDSPCVGAGQYIAGVKHFGGVSMNPAAPDIGAFRYFAARTAASGRRAALFRG